MSSKNIKIITIVLSLGIFILSLFQNAVITNFNNEVKTAASWEYLLMGAISFVGGGLLEEIIWLANPLCLLAIIFLINNKNTAIGLSLAALFLAASFASWNEILASESGSTAKIVSLELGYYLWVLSILILVIGILVNNKVILKETIES